MKLPNKFQFRLKHYPGFTHTAGVNEIGDYEVKWARGYPEHIKVIPVRVFSSEDVEWMANDGYWQIVDEAPQEQSLPELTDEFYIETSAGKYKFTKEGSAQWRCSTTRNTLTAMWDGYKITEHIARGAWKLLEESVLTAEQQRANKEAREQIAQLNSSIRISEQNVEHQLRLQASYKERIGILNGKIVEE